MTESTKSVTTPENGVGFLFAISESEDTDHVRPETRYAESFDHFYRVLCGLPRRAKKLGEMAVSAAFSPKIGSTGHRKKENAQPFPVLILDADTVPDGSYERIQGALTSLDAFTYVSHGNGAPKFATHRATEVKERIAKGEKIGKTTIKFYGRGGYPNDGRIFTGVATDPTGQPIVLKPAGERFRVLIHLDRAPSPIERESLWAWACAHFGMQFDSSAKGAEHLMFTPRINCRDKDIKRFHGAPLCVDQALEEYRKANPAPAAAGTLFDAASDFTSGYSNRLDFSRITDPRKDPMRKVLSERGLWDGEMKGNALVITCPFEHEHSMAGGKSETLYYPAGCQDNSRQDGEPYLLGHFHCLHTCSSRHDESEFFEACGVNYKEYCRACLGETTAHFYGEESRLFNTEPDGSVWVRKQGGTARLICRGLEVCGTLADTSSDNHQLRIRFKDPRGRLHCANITRGDIFANENKSFLKKLCDEGLQLGGRNSGAHLLEYLSKYPIVFLPRYTGSDSLGWVETEENGLTFVQVEKTLGGKTNAEDSPASRIIYTGRTGRAPNMATRGTLDDWKRNLAAHCLHSSRLTFAVCVAFGAPCLHLLGVEGGAFNIYGPSGKGKSSSSRMAATVYGVGDWLGRGYIRSWKASDAGFEQTCLGHNDLPLILEEAVQCEQKLRGDRAYTWANGTAKGRGTVVNGEIDLREQETWRSLGLSTAEMTVEAWIKEGNPRARIYAGQLTRLTDIYACPVSDELGVFESVPAGTTAKEIADNIRENAVKFYGTAGEAWLKWLEANREEAVRRLRAHFTAFRARLSSTSTESQYLRVLDRFSLCAAAGALATELGLTGWDAAPFGPQFVEKQVEACAREALKPFRAGVEYLANLGKLLQLCTTQRAHFTRATDMSEDRKPAPWYGTCWYAKAEGDLTPIFEIGVGNDFDPSPENLSGEGEKKAPAAGNTEAEYRHVFFIHRQAFYDLIGGKTAAAMLAKWLVEHGAIALINHGKEGEGQSRLGAKYGLGRGGKSTGYVVLYDKLEALYTELTRD